MKSLFLITVLPLLAFTTTALAQSTRYFLFGASAAEFPGGTEDVVYKPKAAADVVSYSFRAENGVQIGSVTGGFSTGKATFEALQINFIGESALIPILFKNLTSGTHIPKLTLEEVNSTGKITLRLEMHLCVLKDLQLVGTQGDRAIYTATIPFGAIKMTTYKPTASGTTQAGTWSWSVVKNNATTDI